MASKRLTMQFKKSGVAYAQDATVTIDTRKLASSKSQFSILKMKNTVAFGAKRAGKEFGIWWMCNVYRNGSQVASDSYGDGEVTNTHRSSETREVECGVNLHMNVMDYIHASYPITFNMNWQQFHRTESGYESTDIDDIAGWSTVTKPFIDLEYELHQPTVSNVIINNSDGLVDNTTTISWTSSYATRAKITVNGSYVGETTGRSLAVDKKFFVVGENNVTVQVLNEYSDTLLGSMSKSASATAKKNFSTLAPTITGVTIENSGNVVDSPTIITWQSTNQHRFQIFINDILVSSGNAEKTATIAGNKFKIGSNKILVKLFKNAVTGVAGGEKTVEYSTTKSLATLKSTVSNVTIANTGLLIDNPTVVAWQSTNQHRFNIYSNDKLLGSGTSATTYTIPAGKLVVGANRIRVEVIKNAVSGVSGSEQKVHFDTNKDFTRIMPTLDNLSLSGTNRDYESTLTWSGSNATTFTVYVNGVSRTFTTASTYTLEAGTLEFGKNEIKVVAIRNTAFDSVSVESTIIKEITQNTPLIYSLEPSNITQNIDEVVEISFVTNEFCDRWEIFIDDVTFRGTTERNVKVAKNVFKKGLNTIRVFTYYAPEWNKFEDRLATRTSTFNGYGKPSLPAVDENLVYNTANPTFTWSYGNKEGDEQTAFEIQIINNNNEVIEEKIVNSKIGSYTVSNSLENKTSYIVMVSIKNKYDLWSDFATKIITTSFNELTPLDLRLTKNGDKVLISIDGVQLFDFEEARIYRREEGAEWLEIAYSLNSTDNVLDYFVKPNTRTYYKVRTYDFTGAYVDSEVKDITIKTSNYNITDVHTKKGMQLNFVRLNTKPNSSYTTKMFAGASKPQIYINNLKYESGSLVITLENEESDELQKSISEGRLFCLRTWRGKKLFCYMCVTNVNYPNQFLQEVTVEYIELDFDEYRFYKGKGKRKAVYLNGDYALDGAIDLTGSALQERERMVIL